MAFQERRYQTRAKEAFAQWYAAAESPLATIILPTGVGKTATAALCLQGVNQKVLWVAHREELVEQATQALTTLIPSRKIEIEMADHRANPTSDIVVGSVQTVARNRKHFQEFKPDIIVIDEYHHYSEDNTQYDGLLQRWPEAKVLGLTATPWRFSGDNLPLGEVLIRMDIGTAVDKKYLVTPKPEVLTTEVSLAGVGSRAGDFDIKGLSQAVNVDSRNQMIAKRVIELVKDCKRQGILFGVDVAHSKAMKALLCNEVRVAEVYGETPIEERRQIMARIRNGEVDVLCNNLVCLDEQTEILTKTGWVGMNSILPTHEVANWDDGKIWFEPPKNIIIRDRAPDEKMVSLETRRRSIRVTDKHKLLYKTSKLNGWSKAEAIDLCDRRLFVPVSGNSEPIRVNRQPKTNSSLVERLRRIKDHEELYHKLPDELSIAECKFIGFWLGDGTKTRLKSGGVEYKITQSESNHNIIAWFDNLIANLQYDVIRKEKIGTTGKRKDPHVTVSWSFGRGTGFGPQKRKGLYEIEPYLDKNGSDLLWGFNEKQFAALIEGYWLADGNHRDGSDMSCVIIHGVNLNLFNKLQALAICRGYRCSIKQYDNHGSMLSILSITKTCYHEMTKHKLQIESDWKQEKVWCVTTTSGNIVTRRKGTVTVMGNCTEGFDVPHLSFVVIARPTRSLGLFIQMAGRGLRTSPGKTDCIILDIYDKIKAKQSRVTFKDMAVAGDLYGDRKRATNILVAEPKVEGLAKKLINFPIFVKPEKLDRWTTDEETFSISSWALTQDQWIVSWSAEVKTQMKVSKSIWVPFNSLPSSSVDLVGRPVRHAKYGEGKIKSIAEHSDEPKILVTFGWNTDRVMLMKSLERIGYVQEDVPNQFEVNKIERLFYLCLPPTAAAGRVLAFERAGRDILLKSDQRLTKAEIEAYLEQQAEEDGILTLVKSNARWKKQPASEKQIEFVKKLVAQGQIGFDLDLDLLTKGEVSSIIEQSKWQTLINQKFGTDYKNKLLGYDVSVEDV